MIFFTQNIKEYKSGTGMIISPIACVLTDARVGFWLPSGLKSEIESKGAITESITESDIIIPIPQL